MAEGPAYNGSVVEALLRELVQTDSTSTVGERACAEVLGSYLAREGIEVSVETWGGNRANVEARLAGDGSKPAVMFACHLDVVPAGRATWTVPPFAAVKKNGRIYGRGAADMKGGIAAVASAMAQLKRSGVKLRGDVILAAVAGEETDSCGAKRYVQQYRGRGDVPAGVVLCEPTDFEVVTAHRGLLWLQVHTRGKTAHGSTPQLGVNAIMSMATLLNELKDYRIESRPHELLGECTLSVNTIEGGEAINVVPDGCSIALDIRTVPGQQSEQIIDDLRVMLARLAERHGDFRGEVSVIREVGPLETDRNSEFVKAVCSCVGKNQTRAVGFTTDGPHFAQLGAPVVAFGCGKPELCHKADEYIELADVEQAARSYGAVILRLLS